ncbi:MAG: hypothetical protein LLF96_06975 [Eubacteriales bacterium]|nr:hypothetical protein [Eubacteriales bacterium]
METQDWRKDRIASALSGENPTVIMRMKSGFAVLGDDQFLPGYCVLIAYPKLDSLAELPLANRSQFLVDMTLIGDAVLEACGAAKMNYAVLMNKDDFLHAHIQARYAWEADEYRFGPAWNYPEAVRKDPRSSYATPESLALLAKIRIALEKRLNGIVGGYWGA